MYSPGGPPKESVEEQCWLPVPVREVYPRGAVPLWLLKGVLYPQCLYLLRDQGASIVPLWNASGASQLANGGTQPAARGQLFSR